MDDKDLSQRILKHLSSKPKKCEATTKLVQALREQKKSLNHCLYKMEKQSQIVKVQAVPPVWGLPENFPTTNPSSSATRVTRSRGKKGANGARGNVEMKILQYLGSKTSPAKATEIAKAVGLSRAGQVNPILYSMEKKGVIGKSGQKPLSWVIIQEAADVFTSGRDILEAGSSSQQNVMHHNILEFQDTQLFRTDISLDDDDTELMAGVPDQEEEEDEDDEEDDDEDFDLDLNEDSTMPGQSIKMNGQLDNGESEIKSEYPNMPGRVENHLENDINERIPMSEDPFIKEEEMVESETENENTETDSDIIDSENEIGKHTEGADAYEVEHDQDNHRVHEPNTTDENSIHESYLNDNEAHVLYAENAQLNGNNEPKVEGEPVSIFPLTSDDVTNSCGAFPVETPLLKEIKGTPVTLGGVLEMEKDQGMQVDLGDELGTLEQNVGNVVESDGMQVDHGDMENSDKILKVLALLPGVAQFVLVNKTKLLKEEIEKALEKCLALGYVSGCSKLWKITPDGIDYIEAKEDVSEKASETPAVKIAEPPRQKQKYAGPPPTPRTLLKNHGILCDTETRESQLFPQSRPERDRSPLQSDVSRTAVMFKTPSVTTHSSVKSLANQIKLSGDGLTSPEELPPSRAFLNNFVKSTNRSNVQSGSGVNSGLWDVQPSATSKQSGSSHHHTSENLNNSTVQSNSYQTNTNMKTQKQTPTPEPTVLPSKYANYPNKSTSEQVLSSLQSRTAAIKPSSDGKMSAFKSSLPPNPMEILSRNLKKAEISPPNTPSTSPNSVGQFASLTQQSRTYGQISTNSSFQSVLPKPPFFSNLGSMSSASSVFPQTGNQSKTVSMQNEFRSLPANENKSSGPVSMTGFSSLALSNESFNALNKNPVSALMEYAQSRKMVAHVEMVGRKGAAHRPSFTMAAFVGNRRFPTVTCNNKKDGRKEACDIALRQLIAEGQFKAESTSETSGSKPMLSIDSMTHFDKVAALTHRGFTALVSQITAESFAGRKVIAGLVMKRSEDDTGVLISLGTGNRCITGQQLSLQGNTVNDSHAEIITRRGFIRFIYKQLLEYDPSKHNPLFEKSRTGKLQIRPKITFHLYISTAPCGDGALFSPRDAESSKAPPDTRIRPPHDPVFSSNVQGLLRTKVEGGEGTIPIEAGFTCQTFDGIQRGERLRTMSCTDKVCRWNVVGMQGALLSHFIEPVYLDSLTLGLLYDHGHLSRAVCCRVGRGTTNVDEILPTNYRLNHPWLGRVTVCDPPREVQKTKALSVNWCFGDTLPEVTDGTTGLCNTSVEKGFFSRCSKRHLFNSFKAVCEKYGRQDLLSAETYKDVKVMAKDFQLAREAMLTKFKENKYGPWVSKPVEEEMFGWVESN